MIGIKKLLKSKYIFPCIHFFLTFVWERYLFIFNDNWAICKSIPRTEFMSQASESILVYGISKLFAGIIIFGLWNVVFKIIKRKIPSVTLKLFGIIFIIGFLIGLILYPSTFALEVDNLLNYSYAIRLLPTYWHSIYTGALYAGCVMVIPHPFSIFIFQWLAFVLTIAYIYIGVEKLTGSESKFKYITLLFFLLPETYYIVFNAYRNNYYTILCLFYFSYVFFKGCDKNAAINFKEIIVITCMAAFIMVWRSEGILVGLAGTLILTVYVYKKDMKKTICILTALVCLFTVFSKVQGIGEEKYYGKDYMIINTTNVLYSILNNPEADLSYDGAEEDLAAIENVIPVNVLKETAMTGYRNYNYTKGHLDFNQTLVDDVSADKYMKAYYKIVLHNVTDYLNVQINSFFSSLQLNAVHTTYYYVGDTYTELQQFVYNPWEYDDVYQSALTAEWEKCEFRVFLYSIVSWFFTVWRELWSNTGINVILHAGVILVDVILFAIEFIRVFIENKKENICFLWLFIILIGEIVAITLFMPEGRPAYLYPMLYSSYLIVYFYLVNGKRLSKKKGDE